MTEPRSIDTANIKAQLTTVDRVNTWVKNLAFVEHKIAKVEGLPPDSAESIAYNIDRLRERQRKLMAEPDMSQYTWIKDIKLEWFRLEDQMDHYRPLVFSREHGSDLANHQMLDELNTRSKESETRLKTALASIGSSTVDDPAVKALYQRLCNMITDGTDIVTVKHALDTFQRLQQGDISAEAGAHIGLDFSEKHYHLPKGFFDPFRDGRAARDLARQRAKNSGKKMTR